MRIDFHTHNSDSRDAFGTLEELSTWARIKGMDAVVITNHEVQSLLSVKVMDSISFIPGIEIYTKYGHILGVGLQKAIDFETRKIDPIASIHEAGGFAVIAHPFEIGFRAKKIDTIQGIDAVEAMNASSLSFSRTYEKSKEYAERMSLPQTAGSDSHIPQTIGDAYVEVDAEDVEKALNLTMRGKGVPKGHSTPIRDKLKLELLRMVRMKALRSSSNSKVIKPFQED